MRALSKALALVAAGVGAEASAEVYCVSTAPQLINAIQSAAGGVSSVIRIRTGTYLMAATANAPALLISDTSGLSISGGWNSGCTAQIAATPDDTILNANGSGELLNLEYPNGSSVDVSFSMLSFRGGVSRTPIRGGCIYAVAIGGSNVILNFDNVSFRACSGVPNGGAAALRTDLGGNVLFAMRSSVIAGNQVSTGNAIGLAALGGGTYSLTNNTIAYNSSTGGGGGLYLSGFDTDFFRMTNTLLHANGTGGQNLRDFLLEPNVRGVFNNNHYTFTNTIPAAVTVAATSSGDPGFQSATSLQLRANSPLRDNGMNNAPGGLSTFDYTRNPRILGGQVDRGAYEYDGLLVNGFE